MAKNEEVVVRYSKESLLKSAKYADQKDIVSAVLFNGQEYTIEEADNLIKEFLNRKVGN